MNVNGKINLFVEERGNDNVKFNGFVGSISHKHEDGSYTNARINIVFDKTNFPQEKLNALKIGFKYELEVLSGWLDCKAYKTKDGKEAREVYIYVKEAKMLGEPKKTNKNDLSSWN